VPEINLNLDYSICTLPRVGSFYLQDRILQHTGVYLKKYHNVKDNKMITIVRDPVEMLTSKLAMSAFYDESVLPDLKTNKMPKDLSELIDGISKINKDFYITVDYKDLISNPLETTVAISNLMDIPVISQDYESQVKEYPEYSHLISSKKSDEYDEIRSYVKDMDLSDLYEFYNNNIVNKITIGPL